MLYSIGHLFCTPIRLQNMLSNEQVFCAAAAAAVCGMRYWTLRNEELSKAKDVGTPFVPAKALSLKDMIVIGKQYTEW